MGRKADEKELKVQEEAVQGIGYDNLPYYNVEDRIVEMIQNDDNLKKYKKVRDFVDEYNKRKSSNDFNKPVLKAALAKKSAGSIFDEDVSLFSNYIYGKTTFFGKEIKIESFDDSTNYKWKIVYQGHSYRGDTMNSWSTTLNEFIRVLGADFIHGYCGREKPEGYKNKNWEHFLSKPENYKKSLPWYITDFMEVVYTIGNFAVVPYNVDFNVGRNILAGNTTKVKGTQSTGDYWDLTLLAIYQYYYEEKPSKLAELLGKEEIKGWLNSFGSEEEGWNEFVRRNFMQPFVEKKEKGFGRPRELWDGHFEEYVLPQNEAQFEQFFVNAKVRILARGKLIAEELF